MARYIDADAYAFPGDLINEPTADVMEVKHAKWVNGFCSNCKQLNPTSRLNERTLEFEDAYLPYCPHCGAKMDGKDTNVPTK